MDKNENLKIVKTVVKFVACGLVELFTGAAVASIVDNVDGGKLPKLGAKVGGALVGLMIGDQVGDYICGGIDDLYRDIDEIKSVIDEED